MKLALTALAILSASPASAAVLCELDRMRGLNGWSESAKGFWITTMGDAIADRVRLFITSGTFTPRTWTLNGNTASISSATMTRHKRETDHIESDKVITGRVPGTEIPIYEVKSARDRDREDTVIVSNAAFRLPIRAPRDLPPGTTETITFDASCIVTGPAEIAQRISPRFKASKAAFGP